VRQQISGLIKNNMVDTAMSASMVRHANSFNSTEILEQYNQVILSAKEEGIEVESEQCMIEMIDEMKAMMRPASMSDEVIPVEVSRVARAFTDRQPNPVEGVAT